MQLDTEPAATEAEDDLGVMPSIAKPFALFGATAGLFAILGISGFRDAAREVSPLVPMLMTAGVAALAGEILRRSRDLQDPKLERRALIVWIAAIAAGAGAASGGLVGLYTWGSDGFTRFAIGGGVVGLAFTPSCLIVFDAARRAGRGRLGALVAATDRRTVTSTVLAGVAFASACLVPAVLSTKFSDALRPLQQVALAFAACVGSTAALLVLQRRDRRDRAALEAHARDAAWLEQAPADEAETPASPTATDAVDLGLGADRWARTNEANYRSSGRAGVVLKGSIARATAAFDECARRRHHSLIVAACSLSAVSVAFALRLSVLL
jgi:hypothetical protein